MNIRENERLLNWNKERELDKLGFNKDNENSLLLEELLELNGYSVLDRKRLIEEFKNFIKNLKHKNVIREMNEEEKHEYYELDALADLVVIAKGAMVKLGYEPTCVMNECLKEIESRLQDPEQKRRWENGDKKVAEKWQKWYNQPENTKYKANYKKCVRKD